MGRQLGDPDSTQTTGRIGAWRRTAANVKVGTKIVGGYGLALILVLLVGGLAIVRTNEIGATVARLSEDLTQDMSLSEQIGTRLLTVRLSATKYLRSQTSADNVAARDDLRKLHDLLKRGEQEIADPTRAAMLADVRTLVQQYEEAFDQVSSVIVSRQRTLAGSMRVSGAQVEDLLAKASQAAASQGDFVVARQVDSARVPFILMELAAFRYLQDGDPQYMEAANSTYLETLTALGRLDDLPLNDALKSLLQQAETGLAEYHDGLVSLRTDYAKQNELVAKRLEVIGPQIQDLTTKMADNVRAQFHDAAKDSRSLVDRTTFLLVGVMLLAAASGLALGLLVTRAIVRPLAAVARASHQMADVDLAALSSELSAMAKGDLTRSLAVTVTPIPVRGRDEVGQMAQAFNATIARLHETGLAFEELARKARTLIGQVSENASRVYDASQQLALAAEQTGSAAQQVTATIQQVAKGTQEQNESVQQSLASVGQLSQAIAQIARGAGDQAHGVENVSQSVGRSDRAVERMASTSVAMAKVVTESARLASDGAARVDQMVGAITAIRTSAATVEGRVTSLQTRSTDIGEIVEVIDDIAEQTNLLALNAAIEAARAGAHGRGFAVVADEVRRLAERSSRSTKEIAAIIRAIQSDTQEASNAAREAARLTDSGTTLSEGAGLALKAILDAAAAASKEVEHIDGAAEELVSAGGHVRQAMDMVSTVVHENMVATEQMAASSREVSRAIEDIASVSEQNSAATQEINASAEEMAAQVEEMVASAASLAEMAAGLRRAISVFKTGTETAGVTPAAQAKLVLVGGRLGGEPNQAAG